MHLHIYFQVRLPLVSPFQDKVVVHSFVHAKLQRTPLFYALVYLPVVREIVGAQENACGSRIFFAKGSDQRVLVIQIGGSGGRPIQQYQFAAPQENWGS